MWVPVFNIDINLLIVTVVYTQNPHRLGDAWGFNRPLIKLLDCRLAGIPGHGCQDSW